MKAQYYAVTATTQTSWYDQTGQQRYGMNWSIVAGPCDTREEAKERGEKEIGPIFNEYNMPDIYRETAHKNLVVVSKSRLKSYRITLDMVGV